MSSKDSSSAGFAKRSISASSTYSAGFPYHHSPQLPYRNSNNVVESPSARRLLFRPSSPIAPSDGLDAALLAAYDEAEEADSDGYGSELDQAFLEENLMPGSHDHPHEVSVAAEIDEASEDSEADMASESSEGDMASETSEEDMASEASEHDKAPASVGSQKNTWIDDECNERARVKLLKILNGQARIPQHRWGIDRILATLVHHRKDKGLRTPYRHFKRFAYQTMLEESDESTGRWPDALTREEWDIIIQLRAKREMERRYNQEIQTLCKTPCFGKYTDEFTDEQSGERVSVDKSPLDDVVSTATAKAPLLSSMIFGVGPTRLSRLSDHSINMRLVGVLVIMCRSAHRNNSNYLPLMNALYLYSAGARVDAITLLNQFGLSVSYQVLQRKLRDIAIQRQQTIKRQATNRQLVGTWDNFEYRENVHGERVGDTVKFRSITMALWIEKGWRIPSEGLTQKMWNPTSHYLDSLAMATAVLGDEACQNQRNQCIRHHRFAAFSAAFSDYTFSYTANMPKIDVIDCKAEGATIPHPFAPCAASESTTAGNISVFEDLNINQLGLTKEDPRWAELLTIWWGDLKTEVQMQSMKSHGVGMDRPYDRYQHLFPGLALWHLRFNYLKMIWEVFYPGGSASERSTLQWAADHWHRDKTTRPTDFHSLEDLTIHSYRARVVAMFKPWVQMENKRLRLHDSVALGNWLAKLSPYRWTKALDWLDTQMRQESTQEPWNEHWNNHVRFCTVVEAYLTLAYSIKWGDVGLLQNAMREACVILQAPSAEKPKYAREMLRQMHILDTEAADKTLRRAYIANALVNPRGLPHTFYEMDLLLEHQNGDFKRFRTDRGSSLQESDDLLTLHSLSVNSLTNVRRNMNMVIIGRERAGRHPTKDASFDILSLADQLYRSKSTVFEGPERGKTYFSENEAPDLLQDGLVALPARVDAFNDSLAKNLTGDVAANGLEDGISTETEEIALDTGRNEAVNQLFLSARESSDLTSDLAGILI